MGVAHLGERVTGSHKVRGSIPLISTKADAIASAFTISEYMIPLIDIFVKIMSFIFMSIITNSLNNIDKIKFAWYN